jgi:hypothetical protein
VSIRTLRGNIQQQGSRRIIVDDGRFNHGYKVTSFQCWPENNNAGVEGVLSLDENSAARGDASDNGQIAWFIAGDNNVASIMGVTQVIDPNHIVIRDLYVYNNAGTPMNYLVILEPVTIPEEQAVLALIKERAQDDL